VFGFSRGAYTARSLAGLIRSTGIIGRDALDRMPEAVARYRSRQEDTHPNRDASHAFRADISPRVVTSRAEAEWRAARGLPEAPRLRIAFLGVWDTVGALGVPADLLGLRRLTARHYRFHDAELSSLVRSARHAVALDERRRTFEPTLWQNVPELNAEADDGGPPPYRQIWFAGEHGAVGGGGDLRDLSSIALAWMVEGAQSAGLAFDPEQLDALRAEQNELGPLSGASAPGRGLVNRITRLRLQDREGPERFDDLHPAVYRRWSARPADGSGPPYRPGSLARIEGQILAHHETAADRRATA
jgi:uncharacterized protein (DUF2235 family)